MPLTALNLSPLINDKGLRARARAISEIGVMDHDGEIKGTGRTLFLILFSYNKYLDARHADHLLRPLTSRSASFFPAVLQCRVKAANEPIKRWFLSVATGRRGSRRENEHFAVDVGRREHQINRSHVRGTAGVYAHPCTPAHRDEVAQAAWASIHLGNSRAARNSGAEQRRVHHNSGPRGAAERLSADARVPRHVAGDGRHAYTL